MQVVEWVKVIACVEPAGAEPEDGDGVWVVVQPAELLVKVATVKEVPENGNSQVKVMEVGAVAVWVVEL